MTKKIIAVYPGRFQPMGRHHYDAYKWLASKFGKDNTFIATSDKVDPPKSPLNFKEKKSIADKYGIGNHFVQVKNPYKAEEITAKYDPKNTALVFMVGEKDMREDPRFSMKPKKDGSPGYFKPYKGNENKLEGFDKHGYLVVAPHVSYDINGIGEMSGTNIRKALSSPKSTPQQFKDIFGWYDPKIESMLKKKFGQSLAETLEYRAFVRTLIREAVLLEGGNAIPDSIPVDKKDIKTVVKLAVDALPKQLRDQVQFDIGSSGYKAQSGDIDVFLDEDAVIDFFKSKDVKDAKKSLELSFLKQGLESKTIGRNVHLGVPYKGAKAQIDFMIIKDASVVAPWHQHGPRKSYEDPEFKGKDVFLLMSSIAKTLGLKFDPFGARLINRETGKTLARNRDDVAKILLNPNATADDLNSAKSIVGALQNDPKRKEKLAQARDDAKKGLMKFDLQSIKESFMIEAEGARIQHPEDLIYWEGSKGAKKAINALSKTIKNPSTISVKWDGSPAIVFGVDESGNFILTDKSGFIAKGYNGKAKSADELEKMFKDRATKSAEKKGTKPDFSFAKTMGSIFDKFKSSFPSGVKGYFKGDLLYTSKPTKENGEFVFKPNITTYKIPVNSDLGKQIQNSEVGIVIHSFSSLEGKNKDPKDFKFNPKSGVLVMPPTVLKTSPKTNEAKVNSIAREISSKSSDIDNLLNQNNLRTSKISDFPDLLYKFANSKGSDFKNLNSKEFVKFIEKDPSINQNKKAAILNYVKQNPKGLDSVFAASREIADVKNDIVSQLDAQDTGVKASVGNINGGEGYVVSSPDGLIKLVNRSGFTAANRAVQR
jgi:hypothetical protein